MDILNVLLYFYHIMVNDLVINAAGRFTCATDWTWNKGTTPWGDTDLWVVLDGHGRLQTSDTSFEIARGDCFMWRNGRRCVDSDDPNLPVHIVAVRFHPGPGFVGLDLPSFSTHRRIVPMDFLNTILGRLLLSHASGDETGAQTWLAAALVEINRWDTSHRVGEGSEAGNRIGDLCAMIREDPGKSYSVSDLATKAGISHQHLVRLFKRHVGMTPVKFITTIKIESAKNYLRQSSHPVKRIAQLLGYRDEYYFSRLFKRQTGTTPSRYRHG